VSGSTPFDCVTLWHSLEHMRDPRRTLETIRSLLAEDGVVLIAVPDNGGWQARLFGTRWFHLDVPRHLFHFEQRSLETLLRSAGFQCIRRWRQEFEYDLMGWVQSALNAVCATPNVFFDLARGRATRAGWAERAGNWIGGAVLSAIALPLVVAGAIAFRGGTLIVAAQRRGC
jgi:SAM-dependent methyltransferase